MGQNNEHFSSIYDIEINYGDAIEKLGKYRLSIEQIKREEEKLTNQLKDGKITNKEYLEGLSALRIEKKQYSDVIRQLNKVVDNRLKQNNEEKGSIKALRAELSNLTKEYDEMSAEMRNGDAGEKLRDSINKVTKEIKDAEYATQRFYRNVGNYPSQVVNLLVETTIATGSLKKGFEAGAGSVKTMGAQLGKLLLNPVVAFFAGIVAVITGIVKVMNNSEERTHKLNQAFASIQPIINGVKNAFGLLADGVVIVIENITKVIDVVASATASFLNFIGVQNNYNEVSKETQQLEREKQTYIKETRELTIKEAETERDVAELRDKVGQKDKYTREERLAFLEQAIAKERAIADERLRLAKLNLANLEREAKLTENNAEMNDKLAEAKAKLAQVEAQYYADVRRLNSQKSQMIQQEDAEEKARQKAQADEAKRRADEAKKRAEEARKKREEEQKQKEEAEKQARENEKKALKEAEDALTALILDEYEKRFTQTRLQYTREIEALRERLETEKNLTATAREAIGQTILAKQQALNESLAQMEAQHAKDMQEVADAERRANAEREAQALEDRAKAYEDYVRNQEALNKEEQEAQEAKATAISGVLGNLNSMMEATGAKSKASAKLSKVLALAEIAINSGTAIAKGISQSQSVPFPANIASIATTISAILAGITSAFASVKSAKFASGGLVTGAGTGTSDSISARLSNGESVQTALSTSMFAPILSAFNQMGGGVPIQSAESNNQAIGEAMLARAVARGVASMPSPVVSVAEITDTANRVQALESLATL